MTFPSVVRPFQKEFPGGIVTRATKKPCMSTGQFPAETSTMKSATKLSPLMPKAQPDIVSLVSDEFPDSPTTITDAGDGTMPAKSHPISETWVPARTNKVAISHSHE